MEYTKNRNMWSQQEPIKINHNVLYFMCKIARYVVVKNSKTMEYFCIIQFFDRNTSILLQFNKY